ITGTRPAPAIRLSSSNSAEKLWETRTTGAPVAQRVWDSRQVHSRWSQEHSALTTRPQQPHGRRIQVPAAATPSIVKSQIGLIEARGHDRERVRQLHLRDALLELAIQTLSKSYRPRSEGHSPYPTPLHRLNRSVDRG